MRRGWCTWHSRPPATPPSNDVWVCAPLSTPQSSNFPPFYTTTTSPPESALCLFSLNHFLSLFFSIVSLSMSRRTSAMASSNSPPTGDGGKLWSFPNFQLKGNRNSRRITGQEKQKMLLSAETGHFSMIKSVNCDSTAARLAVFAHFMLVFIGPCILQIWWPNWMVKKLNSFCTTTFGTNSLTDSNRLLWRQVQNLVFPRCLQFRRWPLREQSCRSSPLCGIV